ncbi:hypothetical protein ACHAWC_005429 [Mediolabrus comicus]
MWSICGWKDRIEFARKGVEILFLGGDACSWYKGFAKSVIVM